MKVPSVVTSTLPWAGSVAVKVNPPPVGNPREPATVPLSGSAASTVGEPGGGAGSRAELSPLASEYSTCWIGLFGCGLVVFMPPRVSSSPITARTSGANGLADHCGALTAEAPGAAATDPVTVAATGAGAAPAAAASSPTDAAMAAGAGRGVSAAATPTRPTSVSPTCGPGSATAGSDSTIEESGPAAARRGPTERPGCRGGTAAGTDTSTLAAAAAGCGWATAAPREPTPRPADDAGRLPGRAGRRAPAPRRGGHRTYWPRSRATLGCWRYPPRRPSPPRTPLKPTPRATANAPDPTHVPSSTHGRTSQSVVGSPEKHPDVRLFKHLTRANG
ncbi:hypothetical protein [Mycolicibacterium sp.]|uniref:hypothetical protein n=1 Tax=Mycolicibacterium sp. TaxID=2320850 RepID=UPI0025FB6116|nr:hypothetical protein [Mycolicibacterium sp.]MCB9408857.1 hypothetical protein [Mycolicibacterium sp.]